MPTSPSTTSCRSLRKRTSRGSRGGPPPRSSTTPASGSSGTGASFGYTGDGLRAWKQNSAGTRTYYLYDGTDPVAEIAAEIAAGTIQAINTFGAEGLVSRTAVSTAGPSIAGSDDARPNLTSPTNRTTFYTFDERGNVAQRISLCNSGNNPRNVSFQRECRSASQAIRM